MLRTSHISYQSTHAFSAIATAYTNHEKDLEPFYKYSANNSGIDNVINERNKIAIDRKTLVSTLQSQYENIPLKEVVKANIDSLLQPNTFAVTTAHQPVLFLGAAYTLYKALHTVVFCEQLQKLYPEHHFVPVFFMGSEDADIDEIGSVNINNTVYKWQTQQTGAVGSMVVDDELLNLIQTIKEQNTFYNFSQEIFSAIDEAYQTNRTIADAFRLLLHHFLGKYGLVVLDANNHDLKKLFLPVIERELNNGFSEKNVQATIKQLPKKFKAQTQGRAINLFYLYQQQRTLIKKDAGNNFLIGSEAYTKEALLEIAQKYPERFSPNVILRPVYQELILPNIIFLGGGSEIGYWLELLTTFKEANVSYPVLFLRNSFELINAKTSKLIQQLDLSDTDLFENTSTLQNKLAQNESNTILDEIGAIQEAYKQIEAIATKADVTLRQHTKALETQAIQKLHILQQKIIKAEKNKIDVSLQKLDTIKNNLFPHGQLQERYDSFVTLFLQKGYTSIDSIYHNSLTTQMKFTLLKEHG